MEKHFKWKGYKNLYTEWWENLSLENKIKEKDLFELKRLANLKLKNPYPNMQDLTHLRLSQLSDRHICRIHDFSNKPLSFFI